MKRLALALLVLAVVAPGAALAATPVSVQLDRDKISTRIGQHFEFTSTIQNATGRKLRRLVAHLNVLSLDPGAYVDPEDWSSHRTRYLPPVAAQSSVRLRWTVQAVNSGPIVVYVAVVDPRGTKTVAVSPPLRAAVHRQRTLNSGGVLPLALAVPLGVALLLVPTIRRRRAH